MSSRTEISGVVSLAERLDKLPDVPFISQAVNSEICNIIKEIDPNQELELVENEAGLFFKLVRGTPQQRLFIDSHLDHPGIAIEANQGLALGSVGHDLIKNLVNRGTKIPITIYDAGGESFSQDEISAVNFGRQPWLNLKDGIGEKTNYQGIWQIEKKQPPENKLLMRSADNDIVTAVALEQIRFVLESSLTNVDITWFFSQVEEVHQVSATFVAIHGTPFCPIDNQTLVIVLEAMEITSYPWERPLISRLGLPEPEFTGGIAIKVNDGEVPYGYQFIGPNLAESLLLEAATARGIKPQLTLTAGSTNAKSYSLEGCSPHIATLAIPCHYKHNLGEEELVEEEVFLSDIEACLLILTQSAEMVSQKEILPHPKGISSLVKETLRGLANLNKLRKQRRAIMESMLPRLKAKKYFPETNSEKLNFTLAKIKSKLTS